MAGYIYRFYRSKLGTMPSGAILLPKIAKVSVSLAFFARVRFLDELRVSQGRIELHHGH
jgi:hypothetical protein